MSYLPQTIKSIILASALALSSSEAALAEEHRLPAGLYVFLGNEPGKSPPRYVTVNPDGSFRWTGSTSGSSPIPMPMASSTGNGTVHLSNTAQAYATER